MKIIQVQTGIPQKTATDLFVRTFPIETNAIICGVYYWLTTAEGEQVADGDLWLTEQEFIDWGYEMSYLEELVLERLGLERLE